MKLAATMYDRVRNAAETVAERLDAAEVEVAVVLGSGLGGVADRLHGPRGALYATLPGFPETTVAGHPGRLVVGTLAGRKILLLCGRVHVYEGYPACEVGFGVRVVAALGTTTLIVTNAAGGIDASFVPGEIVEQGTSGLLSPVGDPANLAQNILRVLEDETLRTSLIRGGRQRAKSFDARVVAQAYGDVFASVA